MESGGTSWPGLSSLTINASSIAEAAQRNGHGFDEVRTHPVDIARAVTMVGKPPAPEDDA